MELERANDYHNIRLSAEVWFMETEERRTQALKSAEDLLVRIAGGVFVFPDSAICEQAVYMLSSDFEARLNKHSSKSLGELSISYHWDKHCGLLAPILADEYSHLLKQHSCITGSAY